MLNINQDAIPSPETLCSFGKSVVSTEMDAISALTERFDDAFVQSCHLLLNCKGRVILIGMGKSGHIACKIAATLASTGTPSYFVHPAEASHGDLGMLTPGDVVIAISYSGETAEVLTLLPVIKLLGIPIIAMTGNLQSTLAKHANSILNVHVQKEACPLGLAPTSSTTATLVMGDAIAITLLHARGFKANDFAKFHPGGSLGKRLLLSIEGIMRTGKDLPTVKKTCLLSDALIEMTQKSLGMTTVIDDTGELLGIFTDGDLRRALDHEVNIRTTAVDTVMTKKCITTEKTLLAAAALQMMEDHKITTLVVVDNNHPIGIIHLHDLLRTGIF